MRQSFGQEPGNFNSFKRIVLATALAVTSIYSASAQLEITGTDAAVIDFTGFTGAGFSPTPSAGQLDSDTWSVTGLSDGEVVFGGTQTTASTDFTRGADVGGVSTGGIYSFTSPDINGGTGSLGVQPIGSDFTPGDMILRISNQTGGTITALSVSYEVWSLNDQERSNSFNFSHSPDNSSYISVPELSYTSPAAGAASPSWQMTSQMTTISLSLASEGDYYLRWTGDDVGGSGSRDEFALDNISVQAVPEPSTIAMLISGALMTFFYARRKRAI